MPTYQRLPRFDQDWQALSPEDRQRFRPAAARFVEDLVAGCLFRAGLRVEQVQGTADVMEMTFAPDGRVTWRYGPGVTPGVRHVVWRRIGTHDVFRQFWPEGPQRVRSPRRGSAGRDIARQYRVASAGS